ncbi:MAG: hypothetical protein GX025_07160 [Clostridiales bacterium]|nr:hypothetical protein [Clostridiales bacterium]
MALKKDLDWRIDQQNKRKRTLPIDEEPEDMELWLQRESGNSINTQKSVFDKKIGKDGINTEPSVFDKFAVFKSQQE